MQFKKIQGSLGESFYLYLHNNLMFGHLNDIFFKYRK